MSERPKEIIDFPIGERPVWRTAQKENGWGITPGSRTYRDGVDARSGEDLEDTDFTFGSVEFKRRMSWNPNDYRQHTKWYDN